MRQPVSSRTLKLEGVAASDCMNKKKVKSLQKLMEEGLNFVWPNINNYFFTRECTVSVYVCLKGGRCWDKFLAFKFYLSICIPGVTSFSLITNRLLIRLRAELRDTYRDGEGRANQWSELVADLWSVRLSHLHEKTFGDEEFVFGPTTGCYGFEDESDYGSEDGFMLDLKNDIFDREEVESEGIMLNPAVEYSFAKVVESGPQVTHSQARIYSPEDVGDFLSSIRLDKYRKVFISNEVSGDILLEADSELLTELGVSSSLDCVRIMTLFPRRLQGAEPRFPLSDVLTFLKENGFEKYIKHFEENQIDGDMLLDAEQGLMRAALKEIEIGVKDRMKILGKFKTFASS